ncbi:ATP-binding protein [Kitasatospora phosalacinea]|uniref:ATP-binding protein n=1 Tax=Kitasatospora phosalacinea TaxID=2065 RepID=UPI0035E17632
MAVSSSFHLARDPSQVRPARRRVRTLVVGWDIRLDEATRTALDVITSELVTNAVQHSKGAMLTVAVHADPVRRLAMIEVIDGSLILPRARTVGPDAEAGRGMLLVERLARDHGAERAEGGKRVWAQLVLPEQPLSRRQLLLQPCYAARRLFDRFRPPQRPPRPRPGARPGTPAGGGRRVAVPPSAPGGCLRAARPRTPHASTPPSPSTSCPTR